MEIIDKSNMRQMILDFPRQFRIGLKAAEKIGIKNSKLKIENLIVCGMGGSALPGDILKMWLQEHKINLPLRIHRDYGLPYFADKNHLIICISYSGNTEETLSAFQEADKKNLKIAAIASGGKLAELCRLRNVPIAIIPSGLPPRTALGFQFAALMKILANSGLIKYGFGTIAGLENKLKPADLENKGKALAKAIKNRIPIVYASKRLKCLARIWKIKFNENSKITSFYNYFPELNHNELVGFENNDHKIFIIILRDAAEHPRIKKRMALTAELLKSNLVETHLIDVEGKDILYKSFKNLLLSDWASYYLALEYGVDPTPVKLNDDFKKRLAD